MSKAAAPHPVLGQITLGYSPMIDRHRQVTATRLTVFPLRPDLAPDIGQLLEAIAEVWPAGGSRVSLNIVSESLLTGLMASTPAANVMIEVPSFMAADPAHTDAICTLHASGNTLLLKGRPLTELPRVVLPCFKYSIIDVEDDRRGAASAPPEGVTRQIGHVQAGVRTMDDLEGSFQRGAVAVLGWPIDDVIKSNRKGPRPDLQTIVSLMRQLDSEASMDELESTLSRDPTLAFKLMRYINSPAMGLRVEITSFRHAIMMLGYAKLKRWLALLLATAGDDPNLRPVMFAAVRRGLLMEEFGRASGDDEMRSELFICGVFSLLDKMMDKPFGELLSTIPVPPRVAQALVNQEGPYWPHCELVNAIESESLYDIRDAGERLLLGAGELNRALLSALVAASQLE